MKEIIGAFTVGMMLFFLILLISWVGSLQNIQRLFIKNNTKGGIKMETVRRRCDHCGVHLAVGLIENNSLHCYCPQCGLCVTFKFEDETVGEVERKYKTPSKYYS